MDGFSTGQRKFTVNRHAYFWNFASWLILDFLNRIMRSPAMLYQRPTPPSDIRQCVRTCQTIVFAIVFGAITVLGILIFMQQSGGEPVNWELEPMAMLVVGFAAAGLIASFVVPHVHLTQRTRDAAQFLSNQSQDRIDSARALDSELEPKEQEMLSEYQTSLILGLALLEGPLILGAVFFLTSGNLLCVAPALILVMAMLTKFPTVGRVSEWLQSTIRNAQY